MSEQCAGHDACFKALDKQLHALGLGQSALREALREGLRDLKSDVVAQLEKHDVAILRLHERIDQHEARLRLAEEASRRADSEVLQEIGKLKSEFSRWAGKATVWFILLQLLIAALLHAGIKGGLGG